MNGRHIQVGLLFIAVCVIVGLGLAFFTMSPSAHDSGNNSSVAAVTNTAAPASGAAAEADFLVTDELLRHRPTWDDVGEGPTGVSFCIGDTAHLTNGSAKRVNVKIAGTEGDYSEPLGSIAAGQTLKFDPGAVGKWNIVDADANGPLFQYEVTACTKSGEPKPTPAEPTADLAPENATTTTEAVADKSDTGKCRLTVEGVRYIDGACHYQIDKGGVFSIWELGTSEAAQETGDGYIGFTAYVVPHGDTGQGFWNGSRDVGHSEVPLGTLKRHGACWSNEKSEICVRS